MAQLSSLKSRNPSSPRIRSIEDEIDLIHFHIKETFNAEHLRQEKLAVTKIMLRDLPRVNLRLVHFSITAIYPTIPRKWPTSSKSNTSQCLAILLKVIPNHTPQASATIEDFSFTPADIEAAIDEIDKNASSTDHDIPAVVL